MTRRSLAIATGVVAVVLGAALAASKGEGRRELGPLITQIEGPASIESLGRDAIELVPAIHPPTSADGRVRIVAYLRLPQGTTLRIRGGDGAPTLEVPAGTLASRIEALADRDGGEAPSSSWRVLDVRSISFGPNGEELRLLRPRKGGGLTGLTWPRSEEGARQAVAAIANLFEERTFAASEDADERGAAAAHLVRINNCASCHIADRREDRSPAALVQKHTDASGLFQVLAVLAAEGPFEHYRPHNPNETAPFVKAWCGDVAVPVSTSVCPDGLRPLGRLDLPRALAAGDAHALRVCVSRRALAERMDAAGRTAFRAILAECAGVP